jgi:RNA polymerase sigma-70 factor (ECF subfamily)
MESARVVPEADRAKDARRLEEAFEAVFQENWARVVGVLGRLVGDGDEAEDLALEAFYRLHANPPQQAHPGSLRGWLYKVATNLGLNALRARQRRQRYETHAGALDLLEHPRSDPAEEVERRQERERVRQALAEMKPRSAQLVLLRHSGFSYAEMAAALGVAPGSVGTLLARAEVEFENIYRQLVI